MNSHTHNPIVAIFQRCVDYLMLYQLIDFTHHRWFHSQYSPFTRCNRNTVELALSWHSIGYSEGEQYEFMTDLSSNSTEKDLVYQHTFAYNNAFAFICFSVDKLEWCPGNNYWLSVIFFCKIFWVAKQINKAMQSKEDGQYLRCQLIYCNYTEITVMCLILESQV